LARRRYLLGRFASHDWSNVSLARGEREISAEAGALVTDGAFRYVRNPIYLAGITLLLGVGSSTPLGVPWTSSCR